MIEYPFGHMKCKIDFNNFLSLCTNEEKLYKSNFDDFPQLYEYIDKNKKKIEHIIFDGYEYFLENGVLHNLYGPAFIIIKGEKTAYVPLGQKGQWYYIDGNLVHNKQFNKRCTCQSDFNDTEIFIYKQLKDNVPIIDQSTGRQYRNRRDGEDYIKVTIDLEQRIKIDQRNKKIHKLIDVE